MHPGALEGKPAYELAHSGGKTILEQAVLDHAGLDYAGLISGAGRPLFSAH